MTDRSQLPPRLLPVLYFGAAHAALALAFATLAADPRAAAGFFYHARMLALVHLVTLGWITASILGALYIVGPIALRVTMPARWPDYTAFALVLIGVVGMIGHFWIAEYGGMAWSAATVTAGILVVAARILPALRQARVPRAVIAHVALAFLNVLGAATMGVLIGVNKVHPFLPGYVISNVFAHAHLAAIGWASMMVVGVAYRLLPMVLPSDMPAGGKLWISAVLLQAGVSGLFASLTMRTRWTWLFALTIVAGFAAFVSQTIWMVRHPRPRPPAIRTPDPALLHAAASLCSLLAACAVGLWLSIAATSERTLHLAMAYGVLGLLGFLAQMVIAMEGRLLPLLSWYWAFANAGSRDLIPPPHDMPWRGGQYAVFILWTAGVPVLALGLSLDQIGWVRLTGWLLLAAALLDSYQAFYILRHAFRRQNLR